MQKRVVVRVGRHIGRVGVAIKSANGFITVRSDPPHEEQFNARLSELELLPATAAAPTPSPTAPVAARVAPLRAGAGEEEEGAPHTSRALANRPRQCA